MSRWKKRLAKLLSAALAFVAAISFQVSGKETSRPLLFISVDSALHPNKEWSRKACQWVLGAADRARAYNARCIRLDSEENLSRDPIGTAIRSGQYRLHVQVIERTDGVLRVRVENAVPRGAHPDFEAVEWRIRPADLGSEAKLVADVLQSAFEYDRNRDAIRKSLPVGTSPEIARAFIETGVALRFTDWLAVGAGIHRPMEALHFLSASATLSALYRWNGKISLWAEPLSIEASRALATTLDQIAKRIDSHSSSLEALSLLTHYESGSAIREFLVDTPMTVLATLTPSPAETSSESIVTRVAGAPSKNGPAKGFGSLQSSPDFIAALLNAAPSTDVVEQWQTLMRASIETMSRHREGDTMEVAFMPGTHHPSDADLILSDREGWLGTVKLIGHSLNYELQNGDTNIRMIVDVYGDVATVRSYAVTRGVWNENSDPDQFYYAWGVSTVGSIIAGNGPFSTGVTFRGNSYLSLDDRVRTAYPKDVRLQDSRFTQEIWVAADLTSNLRIRLALVREQDCGTQDQLQPTCGNVTREVGILSYSF